MVEWKSKATWKDRNWKYVNAASTDISKTIARIKRELKELEEQKALSQPKVTQLRKTGTQGAK